ncbi:hypothetical protein BBF96_13750 [Anoxybacter fermentans]|uniref:Uncharacterized protein n=1 Tax=Anoxybacter fermentans TaxID=1323375 RepID=A0A3Q9HSL5_9FIRM|nr:hypothetical protein [Anoxybacter fermentans]AZR74358.1 hypothetical protein BBF96_13750 [Anoxybacter fermentans]
MKDTKNIKEILKFTLLGLIGFIVFYIISIMKENRIYELKEVLNYIEIKYIVLCIILMLFFGITRVILRKYNK